MAREVFLITYSQAAAHYTKESFAAIVVTAFNAMGHAVEKWVYGKERHVRNGHHFHIVLKFSRQIRWTRVKRQIESDHADIRLHFSDRQREDRERNAYDGAYHYAIKGGDFVSSPNHPTPADAEGHKKKRLKNIDFMNLVVQKDVKTVLQVHALAKTNSTAGNHSVIVFMSSKGDRKTAELLKLAWDIDDAPDTLLRLETDRISLLCDTARNGACTCTATGLWQQLANEVLARNGIALDAYTQAVVAALTLGRGKFRNLLHIGGTSTGKTFLTKPLSVLYKAFQNPSRGTFNWSGIEQKEIVVLNDFRWGADVIPWELFLLLLEGDTVMLPVKFQNDLCYTRDAPVFATSRSTIKFGKYGDEGEMEDNMMASRWKVFEFKYEFKKDEQVACDSCIFCYI